MANGGRELASLDFADLIGAPLVAAVEAQAKSALATVEFIRDVGFEVDDDGNIVDVRYVDFKYERDGTVTSIKVPLLSIVPIPFLRIEEFKLEFLAKINSVIYHDTIAFTGSRRKLKLKGRTFLGKAKLKTSYSHQRITRQGMKKTSEYSMHITITAVQDDLPVGLERILTLLEASLPEPDSGSGSDSGSTT